MKYRLDRDTIGDIEVPAAAYWGPQTQRSLKNFAIGADRFDDTFIGALATVKLAAAKANIRLNNIPPDIAKLIEQAATDVLEGRLTDQFPLSVWQTGSGTQTNMNMNEVLANRANELAGEPRGQNNPVHPNDHVNRSQSSNDVFPTAMHIAAADAMNTQLLPSVRDLSKALEEKAQVFKDDVKIGRTHMMDATPITLGQEFSGYHAQTMFAYNALSNALEYLYPLAIGGTAVGTGLNSPRKWSDTVCDEINKLTGLPFVPADNKFMALSAHDALLNLSSALKQLASTLMVIGNNLRMLASGPRCGIGEVILPANEPGSSIMPGKVNPTQVEALTMVCAQVIGLDGATTIAASQGNLQLNVFKPLIIHNVLQSIRLLSDACNSFNQNCIKGIQANHPRMKMHLQNSLMLVTALAPQLGYDQAAAIAKQAYLENKTLKEVVLERGVMSADDFDRSVDPIQMLANS